MHIDHAITEESLRQAFDFFDEDKKNFIVISDLRRVFGKHCSEAMLERIMQETDTDDDKQISFDDFKQMMKKYKSRKTTLMGFKTQSAIPCEEKQK